METLEMFNVGEIDSTFHFDDPYQLKGTDKKDCLDKMVEWVEEYLKIENPSKQQKNLFFEACNKLREESQRQINRITKARNYYDKLKDDLVQKELELFKNQAKLSFMEKYRENIQNGSFTQEMSKELDRITRSERVACYSVKGITISLKNCDECKHKICLRTKDKNNEVD